MTQKKAAIHECGKSRLNCSICSVCYLVRAKKSLERTNNSQKTILLKTRKALALKLANPRLLKISFHTFRHWKATQLYHETKDPYYVKDFLGHKELRNTEIYINIERTIFESSTDDFTVKVTSDPEEVKSLLEVGFEYVC